MALKKQRDRLKPQERLLVFVSGVVLLLCLFYRAAFVPAVARLQGMEEEIRLEAKKLAAHRLSIAHRDPISRLSSQYEHLVRAAGPDEEELSGLLKEIEALARSAEVTVVNLKPWPVTEVKFMKSYQALIDTESTFSGLVRFLYQIEISSELLRIERLDVKGDEKSPGLLRSAVRISKGVFKAPDKAAGS